MKKGCTFAFAKLMSSNTYSVRASVKCSVLDDEYGLFLCPGAERSTFYEFWINRNSGCLSGIFSLLGVRTY